MLWVILVVVLAAGLALAWTMLRRQRRARTQAALEQELARVDTLAQLNIFIKRLLRSRDPRIDTLHGEALADVICQHAGTHSQAAHRLATSVYRHPEAPVDEELRALATALLLRHEFAS